MDHRLHHKPWDGPGGYLVASPSFRRSAATLMGLIFGLALVVRLVPTVRFAIWGSDTGEYLFLTRQLVDTGRIIFDYEGWGLAYPYFPGMFVVSGAVEAVLGVRVETAVKYTVPMLSALIPMMVGLLGYRVTSDPRVGVISAAMTAVAATIIILTSHAMPGTLGQLFLIGLLLWLPDTSRDLRHLVPAGLLAAALLVTHHLTTYFAIGILAMVMLHREMLQDRTDVARVRGEVPLAGGLLLGALLWWLGVASPFRDQIVGDALPLPAWATTLLFLAALAGLVALVRFKRRHSRTILPPAYVAIVRQSRVYVSFVVGLLLLVGAFIVWRVPGTQFSVAPSALLFVAPIILWFGFAPAGFSALRFHRHGTLIIGWAYAILASLAFAIVTESHVLFPFRHVDYLSFALAIPAAVGLLMAYDQTVATGGPTQRRVWRARWVAAVLTLVFVSAVFSQPTRDAMGGFEEAITRDEYAAVLFVRDNPELFPAGSTFAADHRISSLLWGVAGMNATWDFTPRTYHSEHVAEVLEELASLDIPSGDGQRIDHVFVSPVIEAGVALLQWEPSTPMSAAAIAKFDDAEHFEVVYDVADVRIYRVNWSAAPRELPGDFTADSPPTRVGAPEGLPNLI